MRLKEFASAIAYNSAVGSGGQNTCNDFSQSILSKKSIVSAQHDGFLYCIRTMV